MSASAEETLAGFEDGLVVGRGSGVSLSGELHAGVLGSRVEVQWRASGARANERDFLALRLVDLSRFGLCAVTLVCGLGADDGSLSSGTTGHVLGTNRHHH